MFPKLITLYIIDNMIYNNQLNALIKSLKKINYMRFLFILYQTKTFYCRLDKKKFVSFFFQYLRVILFLIGVLLNQQ